MSNTILIATAAGIGIYAVSKMEDGDEAPPPPAVPPPVLTGPSTSPTPNASPPFVKPMPARVGVSIGNMMGAGGIIGRAAGQGGGKKPAGGIDVLGGNLSKQELENLTKEKLAELEKRAKEEYKKMSSEARKAGAAALNEQLKLQPPLTGNESWQDVSKVVGGAVGAAAAGAACAPVGLTAVCAPLGAMLGAYLGPKVGKWLSDTWDDVEDYAAKAWRGIKTGIGKLKFW